MIFKENVLYHVNYMKSLLNDQNYLKLQTDSDTETDAVGEINFSHN